MILACSCGLMRKLQINKLTLWLYSSRSITMLYSFMTDKSHPSWHFQKETNMYHQ